MSYPVFVRIKCVWLSRHEAGYAIDQFFGSAGEFFVDRTTAVWGFVSIWKLGQSKQVIDRHVKIESDGDFDGIRRFIKIALIGGDIMFG